MLRVLGFFQLNFCNCWKLSDIFENFYVLSLQLKARIVFKFALI